MNKDENNKRLAAWLGVPCWHEQDIWHCKKCNANLYEVEKATGQVNPDYYSNDGFFALLDGLRDKGYRVQVSAIRKSSIPGTEIRVNLDACNTDTVTGWASDLPTAIVEAAIQAMEASDG